MYDHIYETSQLFPNELPVLGDIEIGYRTYTFTVVPRIECVIPWGTYLGTQWHNTPCYATGEPVMS